MQITSVDELPDRLKVKPDERDDGDVEFNTYSEV